MRARISAVNSYVPAMRVDNAALLESVTASFPLPSPGALQRLFGVHTRHFAAADEQVSDMAATAARAIVDSVGPAHIDLLLFASACGDLIEPATGNIVQHKLGLRCPAIDIKNACNSFVSAIQIGTAFIENGTYRRVLIVSGEKLSDAIRRHYESQAELAGGLAGFTLGDAGAAMLMEATDDVGRGVVFQRFWTLGEYWKLCTIPGGGSMFPHETDAYYFRGQTAEMRDIFCREASHRWFACQEQLGWDADDIQWLFTHQVSEDTFRIVADITRVPTERIVKVFSRYGNIAAASIPVCMASVQDRFRPGDKILLAGLAAGISISFQAVVW